MRLHPSVSNQWFKRVIYKLAQRMLDRAHHPACILISEHTGHGEHDPYWINNKFLLGKKTIKALILTTGV